MSRSRTIRRSLAVAGALVVAATATACSSDGIGSELEDSGSAGTPVAPAASGLGVSARELDVDIEAPTVVLGAADGTLLVAERAGNVRRIDPNDPSNSSLVLDLTADVGDISGEKGLLGRAHDDGEHHDRQGARARE